MMKENKEIKQEHNGGKTKGILKNVWMTFVLFLYNLNLKGFLNGKLYRGPFKGICMPGLHCYSCPLAVGSCPLGTLQNALGSLKRQINYYSLGVLLLCSASLGRFICGLLCPFGIIQEFLYKIPTPKWKPAFRFLRYLKYVVLVVLVILFPIVTMLEKGIGVPGFCRYLCPAGSLAGSVLVTLDESMRPLIGSLFWIKLGILIAIILLSIFTFRPFCRVLCPLGAIYGFFNKIAILKYHVKPHTCTGCGACKQVCNVSIDPVKQCNSAECVRCGKCKEVCPTGAITVVPKLPTPSKNGKIE